jgi:prepilin-type N-terminal cleavage/methylation domain-containing protein
MFRITTPPARRLLPMRPARGFTMIELLVTLSVLAILALALTAVLMTANRGKTSTVNNIESVQAARSALEMIADDLRSAGYGADQVSNPPQQPIAYVDSTELIVAENLQPFPDTTAGTHAPPLAYNPAGFPKPKTLNGTSWAPPMKYKTGAELVRYTLDVNNDGVIDANDRVGTAAARQKNPDAYVLVRQVWGDSTGNLAGYNGGDKNEVALVNKPGSTASALYTVYLQGIATPWDWANGPIPEAQLQNIDRIVVNVTAPSTKPDSRGNYSRTVLTTEVNTSRNIPNWGVPTYPVTGVVFNDLNKSHSRDAGEPGLAGVPVRVGRTYTGFTDLSGNFTIRVPAGTYSVRHYPLPQYGNFNSPDSFVVTVPPVPTSRAFADTARHGGTANVTAFNDLNGNNIQDVGEPGMSGAGILLSPAGTTTYTDITGSDQIFVQTGNYTVTCTPPDSFVVTNTNPQSGTMIDGGTTTHVFALVKGAMGIVKGMVFRDNNRNGLLDAGEQGIQGVWVGVTTDGGVTIKGYGTTDANGNYSIQVPINDPPHTTAYAIYIVVPNGYFASSRTAITPIWLQSGQTLSNNDFGVVAYQIIRLNASRVLSLASSDLMENDWTGNNFSHAHGDADIVLGADAGGTDNISVWFNQYDSTPLFSPDPNATPLGQYGYTRNAANSVLSLAVDTLDANVSPFNRPDVATGTQYATAGNLFVWFNQNTSGNYGFLPANPNLSYTTNDRGNVQALLAYDCGGGNKLDLIAGTKSPTAGQGTVEVWVSDDAASPTYTRDEIYPPAGVIPSGTMGEVTCMALADFDGDGKKDLVVGTKTGSYSGQLLFFKFVSKLNGARFVYQSSQNFSQAAITSVTCLDVDGDGFTDVVAGTQTSTSAGQLLYFHNRDLGVAFNFKQLRAIDAPGIVSSLISADFGGGSGKDIAMGWRASDTGYGGGVLIYYTDLGTIPSVGVDPSAGSVTNYVPALTVNNFNYGTYPSTPSPPYLMDLAAGLKASATTGALVVFIR